MPSASRAIKAARAADRLWLTKRRTSHSFHVVRHYRFLPLSGEGWSARAGLAVIKVGSARGWAAAGFINT
jgi:hypothetical protein